MRDRLLRFLRLGTFRSGSDAVRDPDSTAHPAVPPSSLLEVVVYAEDCILTGRIRGSTDGLIDMLDRRDAFQLVDVRVEPLDQTRVVDVEEVLVMRDEIMLVQANEAQDGPARRRRTCEQPIAIRLGRYEVRGNNRSAHGADPVASVRRGAAMVSLTDASVEYEIGPVRERRSAGTIVVNRQHIEVIAPTFET